jgi:Protein of unknown function (DUF3179)
MTRPSTRPGPDRRRALLAVVAFALLAAACSSSSGDEIVTEPGDAPAATSSEPTPATCSANPEPAERVTPGPREDVPSALRDASSDSFPAPLVELNDIRSGGPPPDGIPPLDEPLFLPTCAVDFLGDNEPVAALTIDGETRAYPMQILIWHEIVNDVVAGTPVSITYCPLCNSAFAFNRTVGDRLLDFGTSGALYRSNLVMYDRQTESLWIQFTNQAVVGALTGTTLETFPMRIVSWADFRDSQPDSLVLSTDTGFSRDYGRNPYPGYDDVGTSPFLFDGENDPRLAAKTRILGISLNGDDVAIVRDDLLVQQVMDIEVGGVPVVVFAKAGTASALDTGQIEFGRDVGAAAAYEPFADDGQRLTFSASPDGFTDAETGSTWNILGESTAGPLAGQTLAGVDVDDSFWFAWGTFKPESRILP